ncbi:MAG: porin [Alistipes sp.]|nr:porin [Alistipes sp.]
MKKFILSIIALAFAGTLSAQEPTNQQAQIDSLNLRIAKLEKRSQVWDKLKPAFKVSGYIQAGYDYLWNEDGTTTSTFHLRRARISLQGDIYKGAKGAKASYRLQIDLCKELPIMDLWVKYQPINQFGVQFGQFKVPVSIENTDYNATKLEFINYANTVQRLVRMSSSDLQGINSSGRDIGALLYGGFIKKDGYSIINYEVGVFNGSGINTKDKNKSKDIAARLTIQPLQKLKIAAYYMGGETDASSLIEKYPTMVVDNSGVNTKYLDYNRYGGGFDFNNKHIFARSEYIGGQTGAMRSEGVYAQVGYKFLNKCSVGVRFDYFDENKADDGNQMNYSVAASYHPWKYLRLQAEYTRQTYNHIVGSKNSNGLYLMVSAIF